MQLERYIQKLQILVSCSSLWAEFRLSEMADWARSVQNQRIYAIQCATAGWKSILEVPNWFTLMRTEPIHLWPVDESMTHRKHHAGERWRFIEMFFFLVVLELMRIIPTEHGAQVRNWHFAYVVYRALHCKPFRAPSTHSHALGPMIYSFWFNSPLCISFQCKCSQSYTNSLAGWMPKSEKGKSVRSKFVVFRIRRRFQKTCGSIGTAKQWKASHMPFECIYSRVAKTRPR